MFAFEDVENDITEFFILFIFLDLSREAVAGALSPSE